MKDINGSVNEYEKLTEMPGVVSVFPNSKRKLHTTHSWNFMGLLGDETMEIPGFSTANQVNVVVGFIDTGGLPSSSCFLFAHIPPFIYFYTIKRPIENALFIYWSSAAVFQASVSTYSFFSLSFLFYFLQEYKIECEPFGCKHSFRFVYISRHLFAHEL